MKFNVLNLVLEAQANKYKIQIDPVLWFLNIDVKSKMNE